MPADKVQRRLAAILAVDVVGYARLMGVDEEGTLAQLKAHRKELLIPKVAEYGGRIVKTTGDGVLVEFPSAVEAVRHAVDVQRAMAGRNADVPAERRIELRMGINVGDVIADGDDLYGEGVNVAARLEALADAGGICVSALVRDSVRNNLEAAFVDMGEQSLKNIADRVRVYRVAHAPDGEPPATTAYPRSEPLPVPDRPSIVVLPFVNISGDPDQEYFVDGITDDLITDLAKVSGLFVIARNSAFAYKGQSPDVRQVARALGVRHALEGSVRKVGHQVRINAQLIDAVTGGHLWAERYDGKLDDIFALQDEMTGKIISALQIRLTAGERARVERKPTGNLEAYDLYLRGRAVMYPTSQAGNASARDLFEKAIAIDPNLAEAYALLGFVYMFEWYFLWTEEPIRDKAFLAARRAVDLDDTSALARARLGFLLLVNKKHDQAIVELERAIALAPNDAEGYHWLGEALNYGGDPARAIELSKTAMRLSPLFFGVHLGHSAYLQRRYDDAIATLTEGISRAPGHPVCHMFLAVVYAELGKIDAARAEVATLAKVVPRWRLSVLAERVPYRYKSDLDRLLDGLRKAGMPE
jgi:adenylate cyclase